MSFGVVSFGGNVLWGKCLLGETVLGEMSQCRIRIKKNRVWLMVTTYEHIYPEILRHSWSELIPQYFISWLLSIWPDSQLSSVPAPPPPTVIIIVVMSILNALFNASNLAVGGSDIAKDCCSNAPLCLENNIEARNCSVPPENISCKVAVPVRGRRWLKRPQCYPTPVNIEEWQSLFENISLHNSHFSFDFQSADKSGNKTKQWTFQSFSTGNF